MSERRVRLDHLFGVYRVGSGDWPWTEEYDRLIDQPDTRKLLDRIREEGIREPILLGTDGRIWDGHHRIIIAMRLGLDSVPVEFAGEEGALAVHDAEVRAAALAEQDDAQVERIARLLARTSEFTQTDARVLVKAAQDIAAAEQDTEEPEWETERVEQARIHYRYGVNSGTLTTLNTTAAIADAIEREERWTMGPIAAHKVETRTKVTHTSPWMPVEQGGDDV